MSGKRRILTPILFLALLGLFHLFAGCDQDEGQQDVRMKAVSGKEGDEGSGNQVDLSSLPEPSTELERAAQEAGLIPLKKVVKDVKVDLKYSTTDNFLGKDLYGDFSTCYVLPELAKKLQLALLFLRGKYPSYNFIVYDGVRPLSVQREMWRSLDIPEEEKRKFLAAPGDRSMHNYGAAVDLSIIDQYGDPLDMGTSYDHRGPKAYPSKEEELLEKGVLTKEQVENRRLLRSVMTQAGFNSIPTEWWHFSIKSKREITRHYRLVE